MKVEKNVKTSKKEDYIMNKAIRIISIVMLVMLMVGALSMPVLASGEFLNNVNPDNRGTTGIENLFNNIIGIVQVIGTGIAVIMLIVLAIKYLTAAPDGKAEIKKTSIIYVVAAVILFAAVNILKVIADWSETISNSL